MGLYKTVDNKSTSKLANTFSSEPISALYQLARIPIVGRHTLKANFSYHIKTNELKAECVHWWPPNEPLNVHFVYNFVYKDQGGLCGQPGLATI